jgi:ankyrin repeat protein
LSFTDVQMNKLLTHVYRKDYDALRAMLAGKDINSHDEDGRTLLIHAVLADDAAAEMVRFLLSSGAKADAHDVGQSWTALHFAARDQKEAIVRALLEAGTAVDPVDSFGNTPLWRAIMGGGSPVMVEMLLRAGADPQRQNASGVTPVDVAERQGRRDLVEMMRRFRGQKGAALNGGPAKQLGNSRVTEGPPSVS